MLLCWGSCLSRRAVRALAPVALAGACSASFGMDFRTVDFSSVQNYRVQNMDGAAYQIPTGTLYAAGGVPFHIGERGNNAYVSAQPPGGGERSVEIAVHLWGVASAFTLINTWWGTRASTAYAYLEFRGSLGATFRYDLVGNRDVRDYLNSDYTNLINGTSTVNALTVSEGRYWQVRLDAQRIVLPEAFQHQTLETFRLVDRGDMGFQRTFLSGVTVGVVPEPASLIGLGGAVWLAVRRTRRDGA